jgi:hypothetical protein
MFRGMDVLEDGSKVHADGISAWDFLMLDELNHGLDSKGSTANRTNPEHADTSKTGIIPWFTPQFRLNLVLSQI